MSEPTDDSCVVESFGRMGDLTPRALTRVPPYDRHAVRGPSTGQIAVKVTKVFEVGER